MSKSAISLILALMASCEPDAPGFASPGHFNRLVQDDVRREARSSYFSLANELVRVEPCEIQTPSGAVPAAVLASSESCGVRDGDLPQGCSQLRVFLEPTLPLVERGTSDTSLIAIRPMEIDSNCETTFRLISMYSKTQNSPLEPLLEIVKEESPNVTPMPLDTLWNARDEVEP